MNETKPRRGRPPKPPNERRSHTLTIRVNDELYQRIRHEVEATGRSLSEEAEVLLNGAFDARARAHEALVEMVARGEFLLQPKSSPGNAAEAATAVEETPNLGFGSLAAVVGDLKPGEQLDQTESELFGGMSEAAAADGIPNLGFGSLAAVVAAAGLTRDLKPGEKLDQLRGELFGRMSEAAAFVRDAVAADLRKAITAVVRETLPAMVREEVAAAARDPQDTAL